MSDEEKKVDPVLEAAWDAWYKEYQLDKDLVMEKVSDEELKEALLADLTIASKMPVEEYTLYQKWEEVHHRYPIQKKTHRQPSFIKRTNYRDWEFVIKDQERLIDFAKSNIWRPEKPDDYLNISPELIYTKDAELSETWNCVRTFTSTMKNNSNVGRNLNYLVVDSNSGKYLGVICISSDFLDLTPRDQYIGWDRTFKTQGHRINFTAIGSTIVPLQPLGYNYVGGKLLALLCLSDEVQYQWKKQYGDTLVGVTTTSLYGKNKQGGLSQYDGLKHWKKMGFSSGSVSYEPRKETTKMMLRWLYHNYPRKYFEWYIAKKPSGQPYKRDHKNRSYIFVYSKLGIPKELIKSQHQRGIYFSPLYNNTNEFLRGEITEDKLIKSFDTSYKALGDLWKEKYASKRIRSLTEQGRVSSETLFYDDLIHLTWEETKQKYLDQVGR